MKKSIEDTPIVFIGAGNLAFHLARALYYKGFRIVQVYSRTEKSARELASEIEAKWTTNLADVTVDADIYIISLKDSALLDLLPQITAGKGNALLVHTAGSVPMDIFKGLAERCGVFYPLQTFSKSKEVDFGKIPFFIEARCPGDAELLREIAGKLSAQVYEITSQQRKSLHLAAVFACNFTNHLYALAEEILARYGLPFDILLPLVDETARKVHHLSPRQAQTGPAVRYDTNVMDAHLIMLSEYPAMQDIYRMLSESIHHYTKTDI